MPSRFNVLPQVSENQSPNARMAPVPQGQYDTRLAQQNLEIVRQEQEKIDFYDAVDRMTQLKKWENESGYQSVLGENARELPKRMQQEYQKRAGELADTIQNPKARLMFQRKADENEVSFMGAVEHHSLRQKTVAEAQKTDAFVQTWQDAGIKAAATGNFAGLESAENEIGGVRSIWAQNNGINPNVAKRVTDEDTSKMYSTAIRAMLDAGNDQGAKTALTKYGDKIVERDRAKLAGMVSEESTLGTATREVDKIFTNYVEWETKEEHAVPTSEEAAVEEARKIKDPKVRATAERLTRERWHGMVRSQEAAKKQLMVDTMNALDGGKKLDDLPATVRDQLSYTERKQLKAYAAGELVTDDETWYALKLMASSDVTREQFKNVNLLGKDYLGKFSKADLHKMMDLQADVRKGKTKEADGFRSLESIVSGTIKDVVNDKDKERFMRVIDKEVRDWQQVPANAGKEVPNEVVEGMTDTLLKKVITDPNYLYFFTGREPLYKAVSEDAVKASEKSGEILTKMKMEMRQSIINDLKADGVAVTDANILRYYGAKMADQARVKNAGK